MALCGQSPAFSGEHAGMDMAQFYQVFPVTGVVFHQADDPGARVRVRDLRADDGGDARPAAGGDKGPQAIEVVRVGERQPGIAQVPGCSTERYSLPA